MDHLRQIPQVGPAWQNLPEPYTTLAWLAGVTERIRLGVLVSPAFLRHPAVLADAVATLDVLSNGRAICGLGLGWFADEYAALGIDFPSRAERYARLEDALRLLPLMWGKGSPRFDGRTVVVEEAMCYPRPLQAHVPIWVGGSGERKTLRLVAELADACNLFGEPDVVRRKVDVTPPPLRGRRAGPGDDRGRRTSRPCSSAATGRRSPSSSIGCGRSVVRPSASPATSMPGPSTITSPASSATASRVSPR